MNDSFVFVYNPFWTYYGITESNALQAIKSYLGPSRVFTDIEKGIEHLRKVLEQACPESAIKNRTKYASFIDENHTLTDDLLFSSPSGAASFVGGSALSGNEQWKDKNGTKLKDIDSV